MPTIKPGDIFFDKLSDGRYEKCILQPTTIDTPDHHAAARCGTGEFYRAIDVSSEEDEEDEEDEEKIEEADEVILDVSPNDSGLPKFVMLKRI